MRSRPISVLLAVSAAALGCSLVWNGPAAQEDRPEQAFERLRSALDGGDWAEVYAAAASPKTQAFFEADFQDSKQMWIDKGGASMFAESVLGVSEDEYLRMSALDFFIRVSDAAGHPSAFMIPDRDSLRNASIVNASVEGDEATLVLEAEDGSRETRLLREDGRWYLQLLDVD